MRLISRGDRASNGSPAIPKRVHLVGAGGIMMSGIGQILLNRGHTVSGSDLVNSKWTELLRAQGATIYEGHSASNVGNAELVVATAAVNNENPELADANARGIPVMVHQQTIDTSTRAIQLGARFVLHSSDGRMLQRIIQDDMNALRKAAGSAVAAIRDTVETA